MNREELIARINSDKRSKEELFDCLVGRMKALSPEPITDGEASAAARRLIGFFETILQSRLERSIDSTCTNANVEDGIANDSGVLKPPC